MCLEHQVCLQQYLVKQIGITTSRNFHLSGSLLPSHGLPPFGANITNIAMSESLCGTSMFGSDRWSVGVNPMTAGKYYCK